MKAIEKGDIVRRKDGGGMGTVVGIYPIGSDGTIVAEWKSCGVHYTTNINTLELVIDWKPRWRNKA